MVFKKGNKTNLGRNNRIGKPHSEETKRKMSEANKEGKTIQCMGRFLGIKESIFQKNIGKS